MTAKIYITRKPLQDETVRKFNDSKNVLVQCRTFSEALKLIELYNDCQVISHIRPANESEMFAFWEILFRVKAFSIITDKIEIMPYNIDIKQN